MRRLLVAAVVCLLACTNEGNPSTSPDAGNPASGLEGAAGSVSAMGDAGAGAVADAGGTVGAADAGPQADSGGMAADAGDAALEPDAAVSDDAALPDAALPDAALPDAAPDDATVSDPCDGVVCDAPQVDVCLGNGMLRQHAAAGSCVAGVCEYGYQDVSCDDGDPCTTGDTCALGACTTTGTLVCDDNAANACLADYCQAGTGCATREVPGARPGSTACGLNGAGLLQQSCAGGQWQDTTSCVDPDVCIDAMTRVGTIACGLNGRGARRESCEGGQWRADDACVDPDLCSDGGVRSGTTPCGLNDQGRLEEHCIGGQWHDSASCVDPDLCVDDTTRPGSTPCGINARGRFEQQCESGQWQDTLTCVDVDVCLDTAMRAGTTPCGLNHRGRLEQRCTGGQWHDTLGCVDPDACVDASITQRSCGLNQRGTQSRTCIAGQWSAYADCADPDTCVDGAQQQGACGASPGMHSRDCVLGSWAAFGECSTCVDRDADRYGYDCMAGPDCDDARRDINPAAVERDFDGADNDCRPSTGRDLGLVGYVGARAYSHVAVLGDRVFAAQGVRLFEYAASDLAAPAVDLMVMQEEITHLQRVGSLLYVGVQGVGVVRLDIGGSMAFLDQFTHTPSLLPYPANTSFHVVGNHMLLCDAGGSAYSVTRAAIGPSSITQLGFSWGHSISTVDTGNVCQVALTGARALVGTAATLAYFDVSFGGGGPGLYRTAYADLSGAGVTGLPQAPLADGWLYAVGSGANRPLYREVANASSNTEYFAGPVNGALLAQDGYVYFGLGSVPTCILHAPLSAGPIAPSAADCLYMSSAITDIAADGEVIVVSHREGLAAVERAGSDLVVTSATPPMNSLPSASAIEIDDDMLIWISQTGGVVFLQLPAAGGIPQEISRMAFPGTLSAHDLRDGVLYVFLDSGSVDAWVAIDLHGAAVPTEIVRTTFQGFSARFAGIGVAGTTLYLSHAGRWRAWDISTLSAPVDLGEVGDTWVYDFAEHRGDLLAASYSAVERFDIGVPEAPSLLGSIAVSPWYRVAVQGDLMVTADGDVIDLSTDQILFQRDTGGRYVTVDGTVAWAADPNGLVYVRLTDLGAITATNMSIARFGQQGAASRGDYLYAVVGELGLGVFSGVNALR